MTITFKNIQKMSYKDIIIRSLSNQLKSTMVENIRLRNEIELLNRMNDGLRDNANALESTNQKLLQSTQVNPQIPTDKLVEILDTNYVNENKIDFIKTVRQITGCGLKEAKYILDNYIAKENKS